MSVIIYFYYLKILDQKYFQLVFHGQVIAEIQFFFYFFLTQNRNNPLIYNQYLTG